MSNFDWNKSYHTVLIWSTTKDKEQKQYLSDKEIINSPNGVAFEDILRTLCRVTSELIRIEEIKAELEQGEEDEG